VRASTLQVGSFLFRAVADHLKFVLPSADGRYVAYGGQLGLAGGGRRRTFGWRTLLQAGSA